MSEAQQQSVFNAWIREYRALLYKVIRAYAFTSDDQDDLFQEISVQVWRSVPNFREESAVSTWLYRIALNTALKWTRKAHRHADNHQPLDRIPHVIDLQPIRDERLDWMYAEIGQLAEVERSLALLLLDGFSYKEMAGIMGISENYVGVKINRIKKHLIEKSKNYEDGI